MVIRVILLDITALVTRCVEECEASCHQAGGQLATLASSKLAPTGRNTYTTSPIKNCGDSEQSHQRDSVTRHVYELDPQTSQSDLN